MIPTKPVRKYSALVDLLDRALTKGLLITADVVISVADVPLIGLSLRLALANMETMLAYGMMRNWDQTNASVNICHDHHDAMKTLD
ncbi:MAG TPA: gas vesicle protein [Bacillota bacterium]|nr:gas vesicle protein [Bacillota bacterium]